MFTRNHFYKLSVLTYFSTYLLMKDFKKTYECFDWCFSNVWVFHLGKDIFGKGRNTQITPILIEGTEKKIISSQKLNVFWQIHKKILSNATHPRIRIFHKIRLGEVIRPDLKKSLLKVILTSLLLSYAIVYQNFAKYH